MIGSYIKNLFIKHNYLLRFALSLCIALYIPVLIFGFLIIQHSYDEMIKRNEGYYRETTASFVRYFDEQLKVMKNHALTIAYDNIEANNKLIKEIIESHPYYYLTTTQTLADYKIGLSNTTDLGLHFMNTDYIITTSFKYTLNDFLSAFSGVSSKQVHEMTEFFVADNNSTSILSTFGYKDYRDAALFIGIPVVINNQYRALIFYILKSDSISTSFFGTQSAEQLSLCIFNHDGSLAYTNKPLANELTDNKNFTDFLIDTNSTIFKYRDNEKSYTIFKARNAKLDKTFISIVPQDQIEESYVQFYNIMRNNAILIAIGLMLMLLITVYVNYIPILKLVKSVINKHGSSDVTNELKTITQAFVHMEEFVSEQKIMLMDYFLGNLLYGISIPQTDAERLDINLQGSKFVVMTILDLNLDTKGRENLAEYILIKYDIHAYITDILNKKHMVLIFVLKEDDVSMLVNEVEQYLYTQYRNTYKIGIGQVVSKLDDIRKSYMNALLVMESTNTNMNALNNEISIIEGYPSEDIMLFLYYIKNGEMDNAFRTLNSIIEYVSNKFNTVLLQRYICYDILTTYIKCLEQMKYPLGNKEITDLLSYENIAELHDSLLASIKLVCENVKYKNDIMQNSLQNEIIRYINDNFTDPNICRTQVADKFGVSIYSLSNLFKNSIGIGFKEYIVAKRMELSRHLLLTTDENIIQITSKIGLDDPDYFSKLFKANYGVPPSKFRNQ